ncbi:hypothetical protein ACA910_012443 [Epithemia clementina (nom. ined.)]
MKVLVDPAEELSFDVTAGSSTTNGASATTTTSSAILTLRHPGEGSEPIAFKVKVTQQLGYLVRPNQGLILPGQSVQVQVLLVDQYKNLLLSSSPSWHTPPQWNGLPASHHHKEDEEEEEEEAWVSSLRCYYYHNNDKFAILSSPVRPNDQVSAKDYDSITKFWRSKQFKNQPKPKPKHSPLGFFRYHRQQERTANDILYITILRVRLIVSPPYNQKQEEEQPRQSTNLDDPEIGVKPCFSSLLPDTLAASLSSTDNMAATTATTMTTDDPQLLRSQLSSLQAKYNELVSFSTTLTAERDMLRNQLEQQTKREFNHHHHLADSTRTTKATTTAAAPTAISVDCSK